MAPQPPTAAPPTADPMRIARYRVLGCLAQGGMGAVYRGRLESSLEDVGRDVALKVIRPELSADPLLRAHFFDEVKLALRLSHRNIVQAFDAGQAEAGLYLVMEWVDGPSLARLLADRQALPQGKLPPELAAYIAREVLRGLDYAHRRENDDGTPLHIVHRDISPGNVLLSRESEVKIADFGIAKSAIQARESIDGTLKGKLPYIAPEQVAADSFVARPETGSVIGPYTDVYAVGAVLYEMLSGLRPIAVEHPLAAVAKIMRGDVVPLAELEPDLPSALTAVVDRALAPRPEDRFASAAAMATALEHAAAPSSDSKDPNSEGPNLEALLRALIARVALPELRPESPVSAPPPRAESTAPLPTKRPASMLGWLGLVAALAAAGATWWLWPAERTPARSTRPLSAQPNPAPSRPDAKKGLGESPVVPPASAQTGVPGKLDTGESDDRKAPAVESLQAERAPGAKPLDEAKPLRAKVPAKARQPKRKNTARERRRKRPLPVAAYGYVSINTVPWSEVAINGQPAGQTPLLRQPLRAGSHRITVRNPVTGASKRVTVTVEAGEHRRLSIDL